MQSSAVHQPLISRFVCHFVSILFKKKKKVKVASHTAGLCENAGLNHGHGIKRSFLFLLILNPFYIHNEASAADIDLS